MAENGQHPHDEIVRFGVSINRRLLDRFDRYLSEHGYTTRSEALRDLIRDHLADDLWEAGDGEVAGAVVLVYDHHRAGISDTLNALQHEFHGSILAATHVHLDEHFCLEVVILRGATATVRALAERLLAVRGVTHGRVVVTALGDALP